MCENLIKVGDYVIVERQGYTKLHKIKAHGNLSLGSFTVEMDNVVGEKYMDTFQMKNKPNEKRNYTLEKVDEIISSTTSIKIERSGKDNREIIDDSQSQNLTRDDITQLKSEELNSNSIVEKLVNNSKTFDLKTGFSQEKYIKKKERKYFEYVQIRKPTIRLLTNMFYRQDPAKILGLRIDDLAQILSYANIHPEGNHMVYDSGTSGLIPAAIMNLIGMETTGQLIHLHPGNEYQKTAFVAMAFPQQQAQRCINVNIYSVLRHFYRNSETDEGEPSNKKIKIDQSDTNDSSDVKKPGWQLDNEKAVKLLEMKLDSLIIIAKDHPVAIVKELSRFLKGGRSLVVFSTLREPLQDLYLFLKSKLDFISIKLMSNFLRSYQVLPERTHPEVNMTSGGYILTAFKLTC